MHSQRNKCLSEIAVELTPKVKLHARADVIFLRDEKFFCGGTANFWVGFEGF